MQRKSLRTLLIASSVSLPLLSSFTWWLLGYGPWIGATIDVSNQRPIFVLMALQGFFSGLSTSAIGLWAAHNLKPLSFMSTANLSRFCLFGIIASVICFIISGFETYANSVAFGDAPHFDFGDLAYSFQFVIYGISISLVLMFARLQLKQQLAGHKLQTSPMEETFS